MFRFKQFSVIQENTAMKVCTDSCLFGALIRTKQAVNALDIGTGTGLLSLMLAQRYPQLSVDAVEIDPGSAADAAANFRNSPFNKRIHLHECAVQDFARNAGQPYDLIFCNPPFYENQLKSPDKQKNLAHHSAELSLRELARIASCLLSPNGALWILLPPAEMARFNTEAATVSLTTADHYIIRHNASKPPFREVACFSRQSLINHTSREIIIYENEKYSSIFATLLRDYYLIF